MSWAEAHLNLSRAISAHLKVRPFKADRPTGPDLRLNPNIPLRHFRGGVAATATSYCPGIIAVLMSPLRFNM